MSRKLLMVMAAVTAISLTLTACFVEYDPDDIPQGEPIGSYSETDSGEGQGFGGKVTVFLTLKDGYIIDVEIIGPDETPAYGGSLIKRAPDLIKKANSVEIVDTLSGATFTRNAIKEAGRKALYKITKGAYGSEDGK